MPGAAEAASKSAADAEGPVVRTSAPDGISPRRAETSAIVYWGWIGNAHDLLLRMKSSRRTSAESKSHRRKSRDPSTRKAERGRTTPSHPPSRVSDRYRSQKSL